MKKTSFGSVKQMELVMRRRALARRRILLTSLSIIALLVLCVVLLWQDGMRVKKIIIDNTQGVSDSSLIENFIQQDLRGRRFLILPRDSFLVFPKKTIIKNIESKFPRIKSVHIKRASTLVVTVEEHPLELLYCHLRIDSSTECGFMNYSGYVTALAPFYSYAPIFGVYTNSEEPIIPGFKYLDQSEVKRIIDINDALKKLDIHPYGFMYGGAYDSVVLDTGKKFASLPVIKINQAISGEDLFKKIELGFKDTRVKKIIIDDIDSITYIDTRFKDQIVYKKINTTNEVKDDAQTVEE